jgi:hypothetical protein
MAARTSRNVDAIALLKADHKKVKGLLSSLEKTTERSAERRTKLLRQIESEIKVHATVEEELFYPAYRDAVRKKQDRELYQEALEEHPAELREIGARIQERKAQLKKMGSPRLGQTTGAMR